MVFRSHDLANILASENYKKRLTSTAAGSKSFYKEGSRIMLQGKYWQQDLAWSLGQLKDFGPKAFYEGEIAKKIVQEMEKNGGLITLKISKIRDL